MDKNPVVGLWFCLFSSCLQVAFLSTLFKSRVSLMRKKFLRLGNTVRFLLCKVKQKSKSFCFVSPSPLKCSSGGKL